MKAALLLMLITVASGLIASCEPPKEAPEATEADEYDDYSPAWSPVWSPDGTKIAFCSDRDGSQDVYMMNADGSDKTRLTNK